MNARQHREFVLAIDPGKITGLAFLHHQDLSSYSAWELEFLQTGALIRDFTVSYGNRLDVVCEQFTINTRTVRNTQAPWSLEVIGIARYFCQSNTGQDLTLYEQKPPFSTDDRLKAMGWYRPTKDGHANDAARQLLKHLVETGFRDDRLWPEKVDKLLI
jgi:hypothetical protein